MKLSVQEFGDFSKLMMGSITEFVEKGGEFNPKEKQGGCLAYDNNNGGTNYCFLGKGYDEKASYNTAFRKIQQLKDHPGHISSYQSRDPENGLWGGALRLIAGDFLSFSGLPEMADEACLLNSLIKAKRYSEDNVRAILALSENPVYQPVFALAA